MNSNESAVKFYESQHGIMTREILDEIPQSPDFMRIMEKSSQIMYSELDRKRFKLDNSDPDSDQVLLAAYGYFRE